MWTSLITAAKIYGPKAVLWVQQNWTWLSTLGGAALRELDKRFG